MTETVERLREHWRVIVKDANFDEQPVWRVAEMPPAPVYSAVAPATTTCDIEFHYFEFCRKTLYDRRTGERVARVVFGRRHSDTEWTPLDEIPQHLFAV